MDIAGSDVLIRSRSVFSELGSIREVSEKRKGRPIGRATLISRGMLVRIVSSPATVLTPQGRRQASVQQQQPESDGDRGPRGRV